MILALLLVLILTAFLGTFGLGTPLGMSTRAVAWKSTGETAGITIHSTEPDAKLQDLAGWAAAYQVSLATWLGVPTSPVTIRLFGSEKELKSWGSANLPGYTPSMAFCYVPGEHTIYGHHGDDEFVHPRLQHEMFHALAKKSLKPLPTWLNEGTAEMCEGLIRQADGTLVLTALQGERLRYAGRLAARKQLDPTQLDAVTPKQFYGKDNMRWYSAGYTTALWLASLGRLNDRLHGRDGQIDRSAWMSFATDTDAWEAATTQVSGHLMAAAKPTPANEAPGTGPTQGDNDPR
jgi:hypothetical protein